jgi:hypothetical protein
LGIATFITPAIRNMAASKPAQIQSTMFTFSPYGTTGRTARRAT